MPESQTEHTIETEKNSPPAGMPEGLEAQAAAVLAVQNGPFEEYFGKVAREHDQDFANALIEAERRRRREVIRSHSVILTEQFPEYTITLRPAIDADIPLLVSLNQDPRALALSDSEGEPYTEDTVRNIWGYVSTLAECFIVEVDGKPVGDTWLQRMNMAEILKRFPVGTDVRRIDVSIGLPEYWGRGIGTRFVGMLVKHAFETEHADVIHWWCSRSNTRSSRVCQKNGFSFEWEKRQEDGSFEDHYSLTKEAYFRNKPMDPMREEYDIENLNPRRNPYMKH